MHKTNTVHKEIKVNLTSSNDQSKNTSDQILFHDGILLEAIFKALSLNAFNLENTSGTDYE